MMIDYSQVGKRIAKRRKVLNMTQDDLAEFTELSNNYISNIENNHSIPSLETLVKICIALDTTPDHILLGTYRNNDEQLILKINDKIKLCDQQKLRLIESFVTWVVEENI
jgi:transcriptional regulator with XRE-family HTH domain